MSYFLFVGAALTVAGIGYAIRSRSGFFGNLLMISGCVGCIGLIIWQVRDTFSSSTAKSVDSYGITPSYILGQQAAHEMVDHQGPVVLIYPPRGTMDSKSMADSTYVFARVLRSAPGLRVRETNLPGAKPAKAGQFSLADFGQAFAVNSNEVAYVSFAGIPPGIENLAIFQQPNAPRLFVFDPLGTTNWLTALKKGVIRRVVVPRPDMKLAKGQEVTGRPEEVFKKFFLLATPETADQTAAQLNTR